MPGQPAFRSGGLAVLISGAGLRGHEFGWQRQHLMIDGRDDGATREGLEASHTAISAPPPGALRLILREQRYSLPSGAIGIRPSARSKRGSDRAAMMARRNSGSKAAGDTPSSVGRMCSWDGMAALPNRVFKFDRPRRAAWPVDPPETTGFP